MIEIESLQFVSRESTLRAALEIIERAPAQVALVVDEARKLTGIVTDGDVRRGLLAGRNLDDKVLWVVNNDPKVLLHHASRKAKLAMMAKEDLRYLPVIDDTRTLLGLETLDDLMRPEPRREIAVIMAGGMGTRLHPWTEATPKSMLEVDGQPIIRRTVEQLASAGIQKCYIAVRHLGDQIKDYFQDGNGFGIDIDYIEEQLPLGTAGALTMIPKPLESSVICINGDVMANLDWDYLLSEHKKHLAQVTVVACKYYTQVPYGVIRTAGSVVMGIDEKPIGSFLISAGINVIEPRVIEAMERGKPTDMTEVIESARDIGQARVFLTRDYWIDVGNPLDLHKAKRDLKAA